MRRLEIHSNYLILAEVEEGAAGAPKVLFLGSEQSEYHVSTILQNLRSLLIVRDMVMHERQRKEARKQVLVRYLRPFILSIPLCVCDKS